MYLIVGENASNKTVYLRGLLEKAGSVVTNMVMPIKRSTSFSTDRINILQDYLIADVTVDVDRLVIVDNYLPVDNNLLSVLTLLCTEGETLILDEPERDMDYGSQNMLYDFIYKIRNTFRDSYVATHKINLVGEPDCICCTVDSNLSRVEIGEEEAYEYVI